MSLASTHESESVNNELNESNDSQDVKRSLKDNQNVLKNEPEHSEEDVGQNKTNKNEIKKKKKKVSFKDKKNFAIIINVESYKKYNSPIEIGPNKIKRIDSLIINKNKNKKGKKIKKEYDEFDYFDKEGDSGKSCTIF